MEPLPIKAKVIGIGGAGCNIIQTLLKSPIRPLSKPCILSSGKEKIYEGPQCTKGVHEDPDEIFDTARRQKTEFRERSNEHISYAAIDTDISSLTRPLSNPCILSSGKEKIYEGPQCTKSVHEDPDEIFDIARVQKNEFRKRSNQVLSPERLLIGHSITRGLSCGGDPSIAQKCMDADKEKLEAIIQDQNLIFILGGLSGGLTSCLLPHLANLAKKQNTLVIAFSILPFTIEGGRKHQLAQMALGNLRLSSNVTIPLPNDLLLQHLPAESTVADAFDHANTWINRAIHSILDMLYKPGIMNLDFQNFRTTFAKAGGQSLFGLGQAQGHDYIQNAINELLLCPLLHTPQAAQKADSLLINITGGRNLSLKDVNDIGNVLSAHFKSKDNTTIGAIIDNQLLDHVEIVVMGSTDLSKGSSSNASHKPEPQRNRLQKGDPRQQFLFEDLPIPSKKKRQSDGSDPTELDDSLQNRGYFGQTDPILFNGQDVDIPTYLRRGINLNV